MGQSRISRRAVLKTAALGSAAGITAPYVSGVYAAGTLSLGCWDHWVPGANNALTKICNEWGEKNKVEVHIDYITSQGEKDKLTAAAEAQAGTGHDIMSHRDWNIRIHQRLLEPLDDVVGQLIKTVRPDQPGRRISRQDQGHLARRADRGRQPGEAVSVALRSLQGTRRYRSAGDVPRRRVEMGQGARPTSGLGMPISSPHRSCTRPASRSACRWVRPVTQSTGSARLFNAFGVVLIDEKDNIKVNSDETRTALEYLKKLMAVNPPEVYAWDDAGNNRWIISGKGSGIMNPPSVLGGRQARQPEGGREILDASDAERTERPLRRPASAVLRSVGVLQEQAGGQGPAAAHLAERIGAQLVEASIGYDLPSFKSMYDFATWKTVGPPVGTVYSYPPRGDEQTSISAAPARAEVGAQIYNQAINTVMVSKFTQGNEKLDDVIKWAESELEGTLRA